MQRMHVAVAAISDYQGRFLLAQRPDHVHQGGLWEFPGGKIEAGEEVYAALKRELKEELDIVPQQARPLIRIHHDYPGQSVLLDVWRVTDFTGKAYGREGQLLEWVSIDQLSTFNFPNANQPITTALQLPPVYLITKSQITDTAEYFTKLQMLLQAGIKLVQFRLKDSEMSKFRQLAIETLGYCRLYGARLLINAAPGLVEELGADGVHLSSDRLMSLHNRPLSTDKWVAASCHNVEELKHAMKIDADFAVLSPVLETKSHPDADTLGWTTFFELVDETTIPVFALGGMNPQQMSKAFQHGAQGVAVLSALWDTDGEANDVARAVKKYLA
jgi:8-oxo-dGTP diphosphatase